MKILDWYIIKKFIGSYLFALGIFIAIAVVFDLTEKIDNLLKEGASMEAILLKYYLNFIPYYANLFSPFFTFISVIFFTSKLASKSEVVAILSSGVNFRRFMLPYLMAAALIAVANWYLASWLLPPANKVRIDFENQYIRGTYHYNKRNIHFQLEPGKLAYLETYSSPDSAGFRFTLENIEGGELRSKLMCERIRWKSDLQKWHLESCVLRELPSEHEENIRFFPGIDTSLGFTPKDFSRPLVEDAALLNNRELDEFIKRELLKGNASVAPYVLEKHNRISIAFATFILTIMGVSLSSRKVRGGIGLQIALGLGLCFLYIMMIRFTLTFATKGNMPPLLASWTPNIIFGFLAYYLYRVAPK
ncbi:MAG: LptF/LptG family permease [Bacteroidia bacterium]